MWAVSSTTGNPASPSFRARTRLTRGDKTVVSGECFQNLTIGVATPIHIASRCGLLLSLRPVVYRADATKISGLLCPHYMELTPCPHPCNRKKW